MTTPMQEEVLRAICLYWQRYPDLRLTQLIYNVAAVPRIDGPAPGLYNTTDAALIDILRRLSEGADPSRNRP